MEHNSIYGAIKLNGPLEAAAAHIGSLANDAIFPFVTAEMFGLGASTLPYYYANQMISFCATYKGFGLDAVDWNLFIMKMEAILLGLDFECAKFHVDSYLGNYTLNWVAKKALLPHRLADYRTAEWRLRESEHFFFGFGERPLVAPIPDERYSALLDELRLDGFTYPLQFPANALKMVQQFNDRMKDFQMGTTVRFEEIMNTPLDDRTFELLYSLKLKGHYAISAFKGEITLLKQPD